MNVIMNTGDSIIKAINAKIKSKGLLKIVLYIKELIAVLSLTQLKF
jgi:hypothetical protein